MFNSNVLIVDDEEFIARLYYELLTSDSALLRCHSNSPDTDEYYLAQQGYKIYTANSGTMAVKVVQALYDKGERIAFGFFDMKMPGGMDGLETISAIRAIDNQVLCSIVTGYNSFTINQINQVFGPDHFDDWDYLCKPFSNDEVIQKARNWVSAWNRRRREEKQAKELQTLLSQIEQMNQQLEAQVRKRTSALQQAVEELAHKNNELEQVLAELKLTQSQLLQNEKMASLGQLAAGMAHEINNPIGFVHSNLAMLDTYTDRLVQYFEVTSETIQQLAVTQPATVEKVLEARRKLKIDFVVNDLKQVVAQSADGTARVQRIVRDLKTFSRVDEAELKLSDINEGLRSTLNIVLNELKYKAQITTEYGDIPALLCYPMQLNQVFLNLLVNAGHAIKESGQIRIRSYAEDEAIKIEISDTGCGIAPESMKKIFEPFYTTKPVGQGTGLGLSTSFSIVKKHKGDLQVASQVGVGTVFTVVLPLNAFDESQVENSSPVYSSERSPDGNTQNPLCR